ncbi:MAG: hypothetical protein NZ578_04120 [Candidatus Binatia bacterium]|nr:hypothetical protein [Candidatus Binatia bacterium]
MQILRGTFVAAGAVALLLLSLATGAWGQPPSQLPFAGELRGIVRVRGYIVCADCTLREVRKSQPGLTRLYQLTSGEKRVVMKVEWVNERAWWESIVGVSHRIPVRGPESVLQKLWAEENLFEDIEIIGLLRTTRVLDISDIILASSVEQ